MPLASAELMNLGTVKTALGDAGHRMHVVPLRAPHTGMPRAARQGPAGLVLVEFLLPFQMASYL